MYLRTISTQPFEHIENDFTLDELDADIDYSMVHNLVDSLERTSTKWIKSYTVKTKVHKEV